jgi:hypothetical protein
MSKKGSQQKAVNMVKMGNFTKNAVESFEENIVTKKDYLEQVKDNNDFH